MGSDNNIEYTVLRGTDIAVSRIGFGAEPLGGTDWGDFDENLAGEAIGRALDLGVNLFDTADVYGLGLSEMKLSQFLGARRKDVIIVSKFGVNWVECEKGSRARTYIDCSPDRVVEALESSLRRLRMDCIPIYLIHWPDTRTALCDTIAAMVKCKEQGKIKYIGLSNFPPHLITEACNIYPINVVELPYNLIDRKAEDALQLCDHLGVSVFAYAPLAQGLLTGKYDIWSQFDTNDRRHRLSHFSPANLLNSQLILSRLKEIGQQYSKSISQAAIRWVLEDSRISSVVVSAKSPTQLESNIGAMGWNLLSEHRQMIGGSFPVNV